MKKNLNNGNEAQTACSIIFFDNPRITKKRVEDKNHQYHPQSKIIGDKFQTENWGIKNQGQSNCC